MSSTRIVPLFDAEHAIVGAVVAVLLILWLLYRWHRNKKKATEDAERAEAQGAAEHEKVKEVEVAKHVQRQKAVDGTVELLAKILETKKT